MAPVSSRGKTNRAGLETSLTILGNGNRLGIFPEGWGNAEAPLTVLPLKRGVAFLSARSRAIMHDLERAGVEIVNLIEDAKTADNIVEFRQAGAEERRHADLGAGT